MLDGEPLGVFRLCFADAAHHLIDLLLNMRPLALYAYGYLLKLAVTDDHGVVIPCRYAGTEPLASVPLKLLF